MLVVGELAPRPSLLKCSWKSTQTYLALFLPRLFQAGAGVGVAPDQHLHGFAQHFCLGLISSRTRHVKGHGLFSRYPEGEEPPVFLPSFSRHESVIAQAAAVV